MALWGFKIKNIENIEQEIDEAFSAHQKAIKRLLSKPDISDAPYINGVPNNKTMEG